MGQFSPGLERGASFPHTHLFELETRRLVMENFLVHDQQQQNTHRLHPVPYALTSKLPQKQNHCELAARQAKTISPPLVPIYSCPKGAHRPPSPHSRESLRAPRCEPQAPSQAGLAGLRASYPPETLSCWMLSDIARLQDGTQHPATRRGP